MQLKDWTGTTEAQKQAWLIVYTFVYIVRNKSTHPVSTGQKQMHAKY